MNDLERKAAEVQLVVLKLQHILLESQLKGDVPGHPFRGNQYSGGGGGGSSTASSGGNGDSSNSSSAKQKPQKPQSRAAALKEAESAGFRPSSSDKWINQQQAIEFLEARGDKKIVAAAKKEGFKPTSSDDFINAAQAREHLRSKKHNVELDDGNPVVAEIVKTAKSSKASFADVAEKLKSQYKNEKFRSAAFKGYSEAAATTTNWFKQNVKSPNWKDQAKSVISGWFSEDKLMARLWSSVIGEKWK